MIHIIVFPVLMKRSCCAPYMPGAQQAILIDKNEAPHRLLRLGNSKLSIEQERLTTNGRCLLFDKQKCMSDSYYLFVV